MSQLSGDLIRHKLPTYTFGQNVVYTKTTGSTNTELKQYARMGAPEGMLFATEEQLVGRGRLERSWVAPGGSSLLISLLFRPRFLKPAQIQQITMLNALAMVEAIEQHADVTLHLKWPNDIMGTPKKKLAGILTESEFEGNQVSWVVVGMGVNFDVDFSRETEVQPDRPNRPGTGHRPLSETATSLSMLLGHETAQLRLPILQSYLRNVEQRYEALRRGVLPHLEWQRRLVGLGQSVTVTVLSEAHRYEGVITGVDDNGALRIRQSDDTMVTILAGDVTLR